MKEGEGFFPKKTKVVSFFHALLLNLYSNVVPNPNPNKRFELHFFTKRSLYPTSL